MGFIRPPSRAGRAPRLPPTPHPFQDVSRLLPSRSHAGQDHEPGASGNLIGLTLMWLVHEASGKGDGPRSLEPRDVPFDEFVQDEQGPVVHGPKLPILGFIPPCAAPQSLLHSPSPFAADESTGPRLISAQSLFPSSHTRLHVRNLVLARAHVGEDRLPLEAANVLGVRLVVSVEVGHHVLEFGWIVLAELAEDEEAAQVQRVAVLKAGSSHQESRPIIRCRSQT